MRVSDSVPPPETFSFSELESTHSEIRLVPDNCGAMQFSIRKLAEALKGMLFVLRFELSEPLRYLIDNFSFIFYFYILVIFQ